MGGDFTYLRTWEGRLFFAFVIDVFSGCRRLAARRHMRCVVLRAALRSRARARALRPASLPAPSSPPPPPQPFAVQEVGAGELHADAGPLERLDRLAIERLGRFAFAQQRAGAGLDP